MAAVADPFLWQHHSGLYLFYEVKNLAKGRGEIGVAQSTDGGATFKHLGVVLDEPWHLSYPFIFGYKGQVGACWVTDRELWLHLSLELVVSKCQSLGGK